MQDKYRVFEVEGKFEIFYCPSAPLHYNDRVSYDGKLYSKRQAAYRRCKQLNQRSNKEQNQPNTKSTDRSEDTLSGKQTSPVSSD